MSRALFHRICVGVLLMVWAGAAASMPVTGYVAWWLGDAWQSAPIERMERIAFIELRIGRDGHISESNGWPDQWLALRNRARDADVGIDLSLALADESDFIAVFASEKARRTLLREARRLLRHPDVAGLHIDVEVYRSASVDPASLAGFREVVRELTQRARRSGRWELSVFLPIGGAFDLYDPASLSGASRVVVQAYDAHWLEGPRAGPVAPLDGDEAVTWRKALDHARALGVDDARIRMSFPLYGYEWPVKGPGWRQETTGAGRVVPFATPPSLRASFPRSALERAANEGPHWEVGSASATYTFVEDGQRWEGWFEDWHSLLAKRRWIHCERVAGMAVFALGYDAGLLVPSLFSPLPIDAACPEGRVELPAVVKDRQP